MNPHQVDCCPYIVNTSHRLSCSAELSSGSDVIMAKKVAECMISISKLGVNGLGNFQFCATACCKPYTPFFPAARSVSLSSDGHGHDSMTLTEAVPFALGLENGRLAKHLLSEARTVDRISDIFRNGIRSGTPCKHL